MCDFLPTVDADKHSSTVVQDDGRSKETEAMNRLDSYSYNILLEFLYVWFRLSIARNLNIYYFTYAAPSPTEPTEKEDPAVSTATVKSVANVAQTGVVVDLRIQQAKNHAIAQAQQDGSKANFRIFDSPFGNFLVPVVPTRAELGG
ncbi:hypothetical protein L1987_77751 [Smallanthus sonchifolius]|uniref:Uncharacterized protein n=1 Tax=Smallanthus sonchifolius TaxID=185202 RepID=A0ACB8ZB89_9ASTR|nr:hypothetical protein L1987_77751 [Smallanthus sonchifolius]